MTLYFSQINASELRHHLLSESEKKEICFTWEEKGLRPFNEMIVSWEANRPLYGSYLIQVSIFTTKWSPWFDYAYWSQQDQHTFKTSLPEWGLDVDQDVIQLLDGKKGSECRIRVLASNEKSLENFRALHLCAIDNEEHSISSLVSDESSIQLEMKGISQFALPDQRRDRLCSPTSTTAVIHFLDRTINFSPLHFADRVKDSVFDIYGNWVLNTAQASHELGPSCHCFVAYLSSFDQVLEQLKKGCPVVISVKGTLPGASIPYRGGHLMVVTGYDLPMQKVYCMDPAYSADQLTNVSYPIKDFLVAWRKRKGLAYIFSKLPLLNGEKEKSNL